MAGVSTRRSPLTQRELRAVNEALAFRLAGEIDEADVGPGFGEADYDKARAKVQARIRWHPEERST